MLDYLAAEVPRIEDRIRSWPSTLSIGDLFTGAGTFTKVTDVAINEIQRVFGNAASHLEVSCSGSKFELGIQLSYVLSSSTFTVIILS